MKKIEKERKWLLKRLPGKLDVYEYDFIEQIYTDEFRFRKYHRSTGRIEYEKVIKKKLGIGVNEEEHFPCSEAEYLAARGPKVHKKRYYLKLNDGLLAEIDIFLNAYLMIMEIENVELTDIIDFPDYIKDCILMEVTEFPQFSNKNLAR